MRIIGLLAQRAADVPTVRVAAHLANTGSGAVDDLGYLAAAELVPEPLALKRDRPGDVPQELVPDPVPIDDRNPYQISFESGTDMDVIAHARAIATILEQRGACATDTECALLDDVKYLLDAPSVTLPENIVPKVQELLEEIQSGDVGLDQDTVEALAEPVQAIADVGFREPYAALYQDYDDEEEPAAAY